MTRDGIFGWSYPPGCSGPPEPRDEACYLCGAPSPDECTCLECPECGACGCLTHAPSAPLMELRDDLKRRLSVIEKELARPERQPLPDLAEYYGPPPERDDPNFDAGSITP